MSGPSYYAHPSSTIDDGAEIGEGTQIWHYSHIMPKARIGKDCNLGQNVFIDNDVHLGNGIKIQNNVSIYSGTQIEDYVFLGPSCVLTNVSNPRAEIKRHSLFEPIRIRRGATIGANATIVCGVEIGQYAFIAAGAVVTQSVPDYALITGVPGRNQGYISRHGVPLVDFDSKQIATCRESGFRYQKTESGQLHCLDLKEKDPLPQDHRIGKICYRDLKT